MAEGVTRRLSRTSSADPGTSEAIGLHVLDDPSRLAADSSVLATRTALYGRHLQWFPITAPAGVSAAGYFPDPGAGVAQAGSAGSIQLATDAPAWDISGLLVVTDDGEIRYISEYDTGTKTAIPGPIDFETAPTAGTVYDLLVPAQFCRYACAFPEFSVAASACALISARFRYYDWPWRVPTRSQSMLYGGMAGIRGAYRASIATYGTVLDFLNVDDTTGAQQSGYRIGELHSEASNGQLGFKVWMPAAPASGSVAWYAATT